MRGNRCSMHVRARRRVVLRVDGRERGDGTAWVGRARMVLNRAVVDIAATPSGNGYWLVATDGGIFSFGDARFLGSTGGIRLNQPIVGIAATPDRQRLLARRLRRRHLHLRRRRASTAPPAGCGSTDPSSASPPHRPATATGSSPPTAASSASATPASTAPPAGCGSTDPSSASPPHPPASGYWLAASDGGIFAFGDARFSGSTGGMRLTSPITGIAGALARWVLARR